MSNQPTFTIVNQADGDYSLAIRGGKVVLALSDPRDPYQQWMRMDSSKTDSEGQQGYALVNKATNEAVKHDGTTGPMNLVRYDPGSQDNSVLWSESKNDEQGFRYIRKFSLITHHLTANNHELHDGRIVDISWGTHISEHWKFVPSNKDQQEVPSKQTVTISCRRKDGYNLTIRDNTLVLAPVDTKDKYQIWIKDNSYGKQVKDQENKRAFAMINKATGKAIQHGFGAGYLAQLVQFNPNFVDGSVLWTESDKGQGFQEIRTQINTSAVFQPFFVNEPDSNKALLALRPKYNIIDQQWKFQETIVWDPAWDTSTNPPAFGQWNPSKADISFDGQWNFRT